MTKRRSSLRIYIQSSPHLGAMYRRPQCGFLYNSPLGVTYRRPQGVLIYSGHVSQTCQASNHPASWVFQGAPGLMLTTISKQFLIQFSLLFHRKRFSSSLYAYNQFSTKIPLIAYELNNIVM